MPVYIHIFINQQMQKLTSEPGRPGIPASPLSPGGPVKKTVTHEEDVKELCNVKM